MWFGSIVLPAPQTPVMIVIGLATDKEAKPHIATSISSKKTLKQDTKTRVGGFGAVWAATNSPSKVF